MTKACDLSAVEARRLIGQKKLSPVELMESCLERIGETNKTYNSVVSLDEKAAKKQAKAAEKAVMAGDALGVLHGLPVGIKDLHSVAGLKSTWGSLIFKDNVPKSDDFMVANVRGAGGLVFAMTNVPEFGAGANTRNRVYGATGNAFNPKLTAAGSSGGAAVGLALGQMPLATGSDYAGSLRTPAAFNGVAGFRPSPGLVPSPDKIAGLIPWGVVGPMGRSVEDLYLLLRAQLDHDIVDPFSSADAYDFPEALSDADLSDLRVAISTDFGVCPIDKQIAKTFKSRVQQFKGVFGVADEATWDCHDLHELFEIHRGFSFATSHQEKLAKHRKMLDSNVIDNTERGLKLTASEIGRGFQMQHAYSKRVAAFFEDYDVLIAPTAAVSPFPHERLFVTEINGEKMETYTRWLAVVYAPTMALCCALSVPCGVDHNGLPFGIQIVGPKGRDRQVLEIGRALEAELNRNAVTRRPIPPVVSS